MFPVSARITITGHLSPDHASKRPNLCDVPPSGNFVERNGGIIEYYIIFNLILRDIFGLGVVFRKALRDDI